MGKRSNNKNWLIPYSGEPEAIDEVLRYYSKRIRFASLENGPVNKDAEDNIKRRLIAASSVEGIRKFHEIFSPEHPHPNRIPRSIKDRLQRGKAAINAPKQDSIQQRMVDIAAKKAEGKGRGYEK